MSLVCSHFYTTTRLFRLSLLISVAWPNLALANPQNGVVSAGQASITSAGTKLDVHQGSDKAVIDWRGFDIAPDEWTEFHQPGSRSITLNRVNSTDPSRIDGKLTANGNIVIVNPNGVLFGGGSVVDVNGLIATTADIDNQRFMDGSLTFDKPGNASGAIVNNGTITAKEAGLVGLVAPNVVNNGVITAKMGRVQLASGDTATVDLYGDGLMDVAVTDAVKPQLVANTGVIDAQGGKIAMTAAAGGTIVNSLIVVEGELKAPAVAEKNGEIYIFAEGSNAVKSNVSAHKLQKQGASAVLVSGTIDASGRNAGERGGKVTITGDNVALLNGTLIDASGADGLNHTTAGKAISAPRVGSAGGDIQIGGDYLGGGTTPTASNLFVDEGVLILNDALNSGDAGRSIFWSDNTTNFDGNVYARALGGKDIDAATWNATAGGNAGDGGFVETSGHGYLDAGGYVDLTSSNGERGTYFLDPTDITIYGNFAPNYSTVIQGDSASLSSSLKLWLDASDTANVNLTYNSLGMTATGVSGQNTITVSSNTGLVVGARIRLGGAGAVTAASTVGSDTYTITNISGTTITLSSTLTTNYNGARETMPSIRAMLAR
jgi:filamentous hemagglutinin family protein